MAKQENNEKKKPLTYTMYDKLYGFNDLLKRADEGLLDYLKLLKRGEKDAELFREAYANLMEGIGNNTITFNNGRYNDSLGRYRNIDDKNKDYYGLMANYIYNKQLDMINAGQEYVEPQPSLENSSPEVAKKKWEGSSTLGKALWRSIYNSDKGNPQDFIDLDLYDEKTGARPISGRLSAIDTNAKNMYDNFDSMFAEYGYSPELKEEALKALLAVNIAIKDGVIGAGDNLALSRAFGNYPFRLLLTTDKMILTEAPKTEEEAKALAAAQGKENFLKWVKEKYPRYEGEMSLRTLDLPKDFNVGTTKELYKSLSNLNDELLLLLLLDYMTHPTYDFRLDLQLYNIYNKDHTPLEDSATFYTIINYLKDKGKLIPFGENNLNLYYIEGTHSPKRNTGLVWDSNSNLIREMSYHDIPYWKNKIVQEYNTQGTSSDDYYSNAYGISSHKKGGILKALLGTKFNNILDAIFYIKDDLEDTRRLRSVLGLDGKLSYSARNGFEATDKIAPENGEYDPELGGSQLEKELFYNDWIKILTSNKDVAKAWADRYKALLPTNARHYLDWYDKDGNFDFVKFQNSTINLNGAHIYDDGVNGIGHDFYRGRVYQIDGEDGYYNGLLDGYELIEGDPLLADNNLAYIYKMRKKAEPVKQVEPEKEGELVSEKLQDPLNKSRVNPVDGTSDPKDYSKALNFFKRWTPDLLDAGRLLASLRANRRVENTMLPSLVAATKNTYDLYAPIHGSQLKEQRHAAAADTRFRGSRAFTSDASLALAGQRQSNLDSSKQELEGDIFDNDTKMKTAEYARKLLYDNTARRSDTANYNALAINTTNRERALLKASRIKNDWRSVDNYLLGISNRFRKKYDEELAESRAFGLDAASSEINNIYDKATADVQNKLYASGSEKDPHYNEWVSYIKEMNRWKANQVAKAQAKIYGHSYRNPYEIESPNGIKRNYRLLKGGVLRPSTLNKINKVLNNEYNS